MFPSPAARPESVPDVAPPPRLLDQLRQAALERGHSAATADAYVAWSRQFILVHGKRHPRELGLADVGRFLERVARREPEPLRAIEAARSALEFLYQDVLRRDLGEFPRPRPPRLLDQ